jgi:hypothetical protein
LLCYLLALYALVLFHTDEDAVAPRLRHFIDETDVPFLALLKIAYEAEGDLRPYVNALYRTHKGRAVDVTNESMTLQKAIDHLSKVVIPWFVSVPDVKPGAEKQAAYLEELTRVREAEKARREKAVAERGIAMEAAARARREKAEAEAKNAAAEAKRVETEKRKVAAEAIRVETEAAAKAAEEAASKDAANVEAAKAAADTKAAAEVAAKAAAETQAAAEEAAATAAKEKAAAELAAATEVEKDAALKAADEAELTFAASKKEVRAPVVFSETPLVYETAMTGFRTSLKYQVLKLPMDGAPTTVPKGYTALGAPAFVRENGKRFIVQAFTDEMSAMLPLLVSILR